MRRTILTITASLLIGGIIGSVTAGRLTHKRLNKMHQRSHVPAFKGHLEHRLELSDTQKSQFDSIFMQHMDRIKTIDKTTRKARKAEFDRLFEELHPVLDEAQARKLNKMKHRLHKKRKHRRPRPRHRE